MFEVRQARAKSECASDSVDMTSKCESVSVPIETVFGLSDTPTGQIKTSEKFYCLSEASVTEFPLDESKSTDTSVSLNGEYCNHRNDRIRSISQRARY